jgi:hypothetical protein
MSGQGGAQPVGAGQVRNPYLSYLSPQANQIDITFYTTSITLTPGQSLPSTINIDAGNDFYWYATMQQSSIAGVAYDPTAHVPIVPLANLVITDSGSQRQLMNAPVPVSTLAGSGSLPHRMLLPRLFKGNSVIQFAWQSFDSVNTVLIQLVLEGFRLPLNMPFGNFFAG